VDDLPRRLIGDGAHDADQLDTALDLLGIEMFAPHRRLVVRYERYALNYLGFFHVGCILILLRVALL